MHMFNSFAMTFWAESAKVNGLVQLGVLEVNEVSPLSFPLAKKTMKGSLNHEGGVQIH